MGDYEEGKKMFDHYSKVDEQMLKIRQIVIDNKIPRRLNLQPNVLLDSSENRVIYKDYEETFEGIIKANVERFSDVF